MRMHPGVSYPLERIVPEGGVELCGVHLPGGTVVGMNAAVVHRNYEIFGQDADEFRPERWLCPEEQAKNMDRHLLTVSHSIIFCLYPFIGPLRSSLLIFIVAYLNTTNPVLADEGHC